MIMLMYYRTTAMYFLNYRYFGESIFHIMHTYLYIYTHNDLLQYINE